MKEKYFYAELVNFYMTKCDKGRAESTKQNVQTFIGQAHNALKSMNEPKITKLNMGIAL